MATAIVAPTSAGPTGHVDTVADPVAGGTAVTAAETATVDLEKGVDDAASVATDVSADVAKPATPYVPRGFLHQLCLIPEREDPYTYSPLVKQFLVFIFAIAGMVPSMGSAVFYPAVDDIAADFNSSKTVINLSIGFYMLALGTFPLWWAHFSEANGRRVVYIVSFALFVAFNIGCALSTGVAELVVFRVLTGGAAASSQTMGASAIGDIYQPNQRGRATGYFYIGPLCGPLFAPIVSGILTNAFGWQSTQYFLVGVGGLVLALLVLALPETHHAKVTPAPVLPSVGDKICYYTKLSLYTFFRPFKNFKLILFPPFAFAIMYNAFGFGCTYWLNNSITYLYQSPPYNYSSLIVGLLYIPCALGYLFGSIFGGRWSDRIIKRATARNNGVFVPEHRLSNNLVVSGVVMTTSLLFFGWTAWAHLFWFVPLIGTFTNGFGGLIVFGATLTYLVDSMPEERSAAVTVNTFIRCVFAAIGCFTTVPLVDSVGMGALFTALCIILFAFIPLQLYVKKHGERWRAEFQEKQQREAAAREVQAAAPAATEKK
ncbi:major facilitator superfamily domain-containing protein [Dipodascopsis tothii]|uniref:major facilitator superfamily domain-containing protein n=1 Tax=Dipodascopsis tothii TaxID=44089 RepID=UPI0034CD9F60